MKKGGKLYCQGHTKLIAAAATGTAAAAFRLAPLPARPRATPRHKAPPTTSGHAPRGTAPSPRKTTPLRVAPPPPPLPDGAGSGSGAWCWSRCPAGRVPHGKKLRWELARAGTVEGSSGRRTSARRGGRSV